VAISVLHFNSGRDGANPGTNTFALTVTSTTANKLLVVSIILFDAAHRTLSGVSDGTNAFIQFPGASLVTSSGLLDGVTHDVWYLPPASNSGGKTTITLTSSGATSFKEMAYWEVDGFTTPSPDGNAATAANKAGVGTTDTGETVTTTSLVGFIVASCGEANAVVTNPKAGNEFTSSGGIEGTDGHVSLISTTATAHFPEWVSNTSGSTFCTVTAAFKETPLTSTEGWPKKRAQMRPAPFKPMGDAFRTGKYYSWR
jgi:hypothetical protein